MDADGRCRPHWRRLLSSLAAYEPNEMRQRFSAADRRIRSRGLSYRVAGEKDERVWPISRMPLLVAEAEWRQIAQGVAQRAELLERVLADVYGEGRLIAEGSLAGRGGYRFDGLYRRDARRQTAWREMAASLRRRHRPRAGRRMVGARRQGAGPVGLRLCAREPPRRLPGLSRSLCATQCRTARPVLSRAGRGPEVGGRARRAAHRNPEPRVR